MSKYIETANFDVEKFPLDCGTLRGMQDNTAILAVLARIAAGNNTDRLILCGCEDMRNGYRGEGYIWKASEERPQSGEIIYHAEQRLYAGFLIEEETEAVNVDGVDYFDLYRHRVASDSSMGGEKWSDYTRLDEVSNVALKALIDELERLTAAEAKVRAEADEELAKAVAEAEARRENGDGQEAEARAKADDELRAQIAALQMEILPRGMIMMWNGDADNVPQGWAMCDGQNGTPDLRNKFVRGGSYSGNEGGADAVTLTAYNIPRLIDVDFDGPNGKSGGRGNIGHSAWPGDNQLKEIGTYKANWANGNADNDGTRYELIIGQSNPTAFSIVPTYYTLCYIMKL